MGFRVQGALLGGLEVGQSHLNTFKEHRKPCITYLPTVSLLSRGLGFKVRVARIRKLHNNPKAKTKP